MKKDVKDLVRDLVVIGTCGSIGTVILIVALNLLCLYFK